MKLTADKFFMIPLGVAVVAAGLLVYKHVVTRVLSSSTQTTQTTPSAASPAPSTRPQLAQTVHQAATATRVASTYVPIKKMRPKSGDNIWVVSNETKADTAILDDVIKNMSDGDIITVGAGTFEFRYREVLRGKVEIRGNEETTIKLIRTYARDNNKGELTLSNLTLENADTYLFIDEEYKKITLDKVTIRSNFKFSVRSQIDLTVKDSHFSGATFTIGENAKAFFENVKMTNSDSFFSLNGFAELEVKGGTFENFSNSAFYSGSSFVKLKVDGSTLSNGNTGFVGDFTQPNLRNLDINRLKSVAGYRQQIDCQMCVIQNIERAGSR